MKKQLRACAIIGALLFGHAVAGACDFCNCLMGINPNYNGADKIMLHVLLQRSYYTPLDEETLLPGSKPAVERFSPLGLPVEPLHLGGGSLAPVYETRRTLELALQHHFSEHLMATATLPYALGTVESGGGRLAVRGLGDPTLLLHYTLSGTIGGSIPTTLLIGGGVKLPLGRHDLRDDGGAMVDPRLQPGTGTFDGLLDMMATAQLGGWTVALDGYGKLNTTNDLGNRIGSSLSFSGTVNRDLYRDNPSLFAVVGIAGLREEMAGRDLIEGKVDRQSGFATTYGSLGAQVIYDDVKLDMTVLLPIAQHRGGGEPMERPRILTGVRYEF